GAMDVADNAFASAYTSSFTTITQPDTTRPTVSTVSLTGDDVEVTDTLTITFSEPMDHTSVENAITVSPDMTIKNFSWTGNRLTITFDSELDPDTKYTVTVGTGAKDEAGNALEEPYTTEFTTKAEEPDGDFVTDFWWILLVIIVIIVLLLVFLLLKKRKPEPQLPPEQPPMEPQPPLEEQPAGPLPEEPGSTPAEEPSGPPAEEPTPTPSEELAGPSTGEKP
ncbi:MAG: Ig-like domain-containing protein, partial [Methanomassiliicoccales archaeon]